MAFVESWAVVDVATSITLVTLSSDGLIGEGGISVAGRRRAWFVVVGNASAAAEGVFPVSRVTGSPPFNKAEVKAAPVIVTVIVGIASATR